jgi:phage shock protein PspC (stress-responsive transcriptional regulator)
MNKVVTINLHGIAFEIEEGAYDALRRYLDAAAEKLEGNPDKEEIIADLEQAIADKCALYRTPHKSVITSADMAGVLKEMGAVDAEETTAGEGKTTAGPSPKRLYRLEEGRVLFGVCAGLAAYFDMDVTLVRVLFVILAVLTHGALVLIYVLMIVLVPRASTPVQKAQAYGATGVTANVLIRRAQESYDHLRNSKEWKDGTHEMKRQMKEWKQQWKKQRRAQERLQQQYYKPSPAWEAVHSILGMMWFVISVYFGWYLYTHVPGAHHAMDAFAAWIGHIFQAIASAIDAKIGQ